MVKATAETPRTRDDKKLRMALISMPFHSVYYPSIQIGLLKAVASRAGFEVDTFHLYLDLEAKISTEISTAFLFQRTRMTLEWLFTLAAFGPENHNGDFFERFPDQQDWILKTGKDIHFFSELRQSVFPRWIEDWATRVDWSRYRLVGFTSMFQQNVASLALARQIKERHPSLKIIFGGANMEAEMGAAFIHAFPFIDYVATGEADLLLPALLKELQENRPLDNLSGLLCRKQDGIVCHKIRPDLLSDLDSLPFPDYSDYFHQLADSGLDLPLEEMVMPFETSRGCWWGEKHHCTFCGLNGTSMSYRKKNPDRAVAEVQHLYEQYRVPFFQATDNIVDMRYLQTFFPQIEMRKLPVSFFYETKANLSKQQIEMFHRGGANHLQPGIESLSTRVLGLMRKGCTMLQNVLTLKWARVYNIRISWNLLHGFPGEEVEDYIKQYEVMKLITHLQPPNPPTRIRLERFSPNFFDHERFGFQEVRPDSSYDFIYPSHLDLQQAAYFFEYRPAGVTDQDLFKIAELIQCWRARWRSKGRDTLFFRGERDGILIEDHRRTCLSPLVWLEEPALYRFPEPAAMVYEYCSDAIHNSRQIQHHTGLEEDELRAILQTFVGSGMMLTEEDHFLSLALPIAADPKIDGLQQ